MILVRVPLRISFAGGGSDLPAYYNRYPGSSGAVCSATINKYIYITVKPHTNLFPHTHRLVYSTVEEVSNPLDIKHPIIKEVVTEWAPRGLDLDVMSDIPAGTGMGSSSAFTVGLLKALRPTNALYDKYNLAESACTIEIDDLKEPIGKQDQYAAAFGGMNLIIFKEPRVQVEPIIISNSDCFFLLQTLHLIYVGGQRKASELLAEQFNSDHNAILSDMVQLAYMAKSVITQGRLDELGPIIRKGWELKKRLSPNVTAPLVDTIIDLALKNGATGGKLLGAGGTGFVLLYCPIENKPRMLEALKPLNLTDVPFNWDFEGAKTLYED